MCDVCLAKDRQSYKQVSMLKKTNQVEVPGQQSLLIEDFFELGYW